MFVGRIGNKAKIAKNIIQYFPKHDVYIEMFFGAGGMFFNKPKATYNFLNDIDSNVINAFDVLMQNKAELVEYLEMMPISQDFWNRAKTAEPKDNIEKSVYFLLLSNFGYMGKPDTLKFAVSNSKEILLKNIEKTYKQIVKNGNYFLNTDFREVIKKVSFRRDADRVNTFVYCDPPYLGTKDNYSNSFKEQDSLDLFDVLQKSGLKWAMSEFNNPFILQQAKERNLNVYDICERQSLKKRSTEILVTNYNVEHKLF
jgi:DNA adenine methylase